MPPIAGMNKFLTICLRVGCARTGTLVLLQGRLAETNVLRSALRRIESAS